jgi:tetratricopeptide (TPR) repeat protein
MLHKKTIHSADKFLIIIVSIILLVISHLFLYADNKGIALQYLGQAELLFNSGKIDEAKKLLNNSLQFYPDFSESCFLLGKIYLREQQTTRDGLIFLERAIASDSWIKTEPFLAKREQGRVYLQIGKFEKAKQILLNVKKKRIEDPYVYLLLARTFSALKDNMQLQKILVEAEKRFPEYREFYLLHVELYKKKGNKIGALDVLEKGLEKMPDNVYLLLEKIRLTDDPDEKKQLLDHYFKSGGTDPEAALIALHVTLENSEQHISFFLENGGALHIDLLDEFFSLGLPEQTYRPLFEQPVMNFTGDRILDVNRDTFFEEKYTYENGDLTVWEKDWNQDGRPEVNVVFHNEVPVDITLYEEKGDIERSITGTYSTYPYLSALSFLKRDGKKEYQLLPLTLTCRVFDDFSTGKDEWGDNKRFRLPVRKNIPIPSEKDAAKHAFRVDEYKEGSALAVAELLNGKYVVLKQDTDENGTFDYIIEYTDGLPVYGRRDLDSDGIYEIEEVYRKGRLDKILYNHNDDEYPDCIQYYTKNITLYETHWDYNSDGRIDAKELKKEKKKTVYLFSTKYNGIFDLRVVFEDDKLISMERGKQKLMVQPGTTRGVYWIGKKGRDFKINLSTPAGIYYNKGKMYFIFKFKDNVYIEVIE